MEAIHRRLFDRIRSWASAHPKESKIILGVVLLAIAGIIWFAITVFSQTPASAPQVTQQEPAPEPVKYYAPLTGREVKDEKTTKRPLTAIMIENSPDARPQSGLKESGVVFEAIAEGGITRFLVLYQEDQPKLIGPVRSLRMYYVDWLTPFNASIAHVGGSARALQLVRNGSYRDIDQFFNAGYYWRATDRYAPHNVYTSFAKMNALNKAKGYKTSKFTAFPRTDGKPAEKRNATKISVTMSGPLFNSSYVYDKKANNYKRSQGGAAHTDREKGRITPSVVIVMETSMVSVFEDGYRESYDTTGSGRARIFQGGTVITGKWIKKDRKSQLKFVDSKGKEIQLFRGQTWISVVPSNQGGKVTWK